MQKHSGHFSQELSGSSRPVLPPAAATQIRRRLVAQASQVAEKVLSFVGRAFRHDIKSAFSSGVLTPEGADTHISATCSACVGWFFLFTGEHRLKSVVLAQ